MFLLGSAIAQFFKYKIVANIIVLTCGWSKYDQVKFCRDLFADGTRVTLSCDPQILSRVPNHGLHGVFFICDDRNDTILQKINPKHFSLWYKWLIICDDVSSFDGVRYDADITNMILTSDNHTGPVYFQDIYIHPAEKAASYPWAIWTRSYGLQLTNDRDRTLRRLDLKKHALRIVAPRGHYSPNWYNGSFKEFLEDEKLPELDSGPRCGYGAATMLLQSLNATEILNISERWNRPEHNDSMFYILMNGNAEIGGGILRIMLERVIYLDYILPIYTFGTGFIYLGNRASSSNMYVQPFSAGVWWSCLTIGLILAVAQRITAKKRDEKEGAYIAVLATWLQQDASSVPENLSGRWSFIVLSVSSMLVHAYYTSAIVSALMSTGISGPKTLTDLAESKFAISCEDYDLMRYIVFEVDTKWDDLEYLKKKKKTPKLYQKLQRGIEQIMEGNTAFHTEYNQIYPYFKTLSDNQLCKLQYIDTIPESLTWITTYKRGQWTEVFRSKGVWIHETGLAKRLASRTQIKAPPCRTSLLAESVGFGDVAPLLGLTVLGGFLSVGILALETMIANFHRRRVASVSQKSLVSRVDLEYCE